MKKFNLAVLLFWLLSYSVAGQTTEFSYQGNLNVSNAPATGIYEFEFLIFDSQAGGAQVGPTLLRNAVVSNGNFSVKLDFGPVFPGAERYLEIHVRQQGQPTYTVLTPRQLLNSTPYAVKAVNASQLGGMAADQYVMTGDPRMTDARTPLPGSTNYVQNTTLQQANASFSISGSGAADSFNSLTQYNIAGDRVLGVPGINNTFLGVGAGAAHSTGSGNAFFGFGSGDANTTGSFNSSFGRNAGGSNVTGSFNSYFGEGSGPSSIGSSNSFFGSNTGFNNTTGNNLTLIGQSANVAADGLTNATAIGFRAAVGQSNSLVLGSINGVNTAVADTNVGIGTTSPTERLHVVGNGLFTGNLAVNGQLNATVTNAAQLGGVPANQYVQTSDARLTDARNPLPGSVNYIQNQNAGPQVSSSFNITGNGIVGGSLGVGTGSPTAKIHAVNSSGTGATFQSQTGRGVEGYGSTFGGYFVTNAANGVGAYGQGDFYGGSFLNTGTGPAIYGTSPNGIGVQIAGGTYGVYASSGSGTAVFGSTTSGTAAVHGSSTATYGVRGESTNNYGVYGTSTNASGVNGFSPKSVGVFGSSNSSYGVRGSSAFVAVYGSSTSGKGGEFESGSGVGLHAHSVSGYGLFARSETTHAIYAEGSVKFTRWIELGELSGSGATNVCWNSTSKALAFCSSSLRYKTNIGSYTSGLSLLNRLKPITFDWKESGSRDFGLGAEDVEKIEPLLVTYNVVGQVEGVKYDRIGVLLINAVKEQQAQIEAQARENSELRSVVERQQLQIESQQSAIDSLRHALCGLNPAAGVCKP